MKTFATQVPSDATRPSRTQATRQRILVAATRIFLSEGYSQTNLEMVAAEAGVTKPTIYSHFESKKGLFDAVIKHNTEQRLQQLSEILKPSGNLRNDLIRFGDFFLSKIFSPQSHRWDRLAAAESISHPEVGKAFFEAGPAQVVARIAAYLERQQENGLLIVPDPERIAEQLIGMLLCLDLLRTQIGQQPPGDAQLKQRCREAVDVFVKAYGVPT